MVFFIWLIIVIVIIAAALIKSLRQKDDSRKKKKARQTTTSSSTYRRRTEPPKEDILTRSKRNAEAESITAGWDETSPRSASLSAHGPETDFSGLMDKVQDLIVKGYEPKLSFERDFISEGLDFLNRHYYK